MVVSSVNRLLADCWNQFTTKPSACIQLCVVLPSSYRLGGCVSVGLTASNVGCQQHNTSQPHGVDCKSHLLVAALKACTHNMLVITDHDCIPHFSPASHLDACKL